jgi:hypothetical protein
MQRPVQRALIAVLCCVAGCGGETASTESLNDSGMPKDVAVRDGMVPDAGSKPDASVGSPCARDFDCPVLCDDDAQCGPLCLDQSPFTGGYCSRAIGECPAPSGLDGGSAPCPPGAYCANGQPAVRGTGGDYCLAECTTDAECRTAEAYKCCLGLTHANRSVCAPASLCH